MKDTFKQSLTKLKEEFTNSWTLLNETSRYLKQAKLFNEYEPMLRKWRSKLQRRYTDVDVYKEIKKQIIEFRKELRNEGHDLRLGNFDLVLVGFKSDDAPRYGFTRAIIYIGNNGVYYVTGEENHKELIRKLELRYQSNAILFDNVHNIWYRWKHNLLEIAGADSETKDQYDKLYDLVENKKMYLLKYLKNI